MALSKVARAKIPESKFAGPHESYPVDTPGRARAATGLAGMHHASPAIKANIARLAKPMHVKTSIPRSDSHIVKPHLPSFHTKARQY
jgi:hypothetical protein